MIKLAQLILEIKQLPKADYILTSGGQHALDYWNRTDGDWEGFRDEYGEDEADYIVALSGTIITPPLLRISDIEKYLEDNEGMWGNGTEESGVLVNSMISWWTKLNWIIKK